MWNYIEFLLSFWLACSLEGVGLNFLISSGINFTLFYYVNKLTSESSFSLFLDVHLYGFFFPSTSKLNWKVNCINAALCAQLVCSLNSKLSLNGRSFWWLKSRVVLDVKLVKWQF